MTPGKVYGGSKFLKLASNTIRFPLILEIRDFFFKKVRKLFLFLFYNVYKEKMFTIKI